MESSWEGSCWETREAGEWEKKHEWNCGRERDNKGGVKVTLKDGLGEGQVGGIGGRRQEMAIPIPWDVQHRRQGGEETSASRKGGEKGRRARRRTIRRRRKGRRRRRRRGRRRRRIGGEKKKEEEEEEEEKKEEENE